MILTGRDSRPIRRDRIIPDKYSDDVFSMKKQTIRKRRIRSFFGLFFCVVGEAEKKSLFF